MTYTRQNSHMLFTLDLAAGKWSLADQQRRGPWLEGVEMSVRYRQGASEHRLRLQNLYMQAEHEQVETIHGPAQTFRLVTPQDRRGIRCSLLFSLLDNSPLLLWKLTLENLGKRPVNVIRLEMLNVGFLYAPESGFTPTYLGPLRGANTGHLVLGAEVGDPAFFSNGWQSWNHTGTYGWHERQRPTRLGPFTAPMRVNAGTPHPGKRGVFSSDMFGVIGDRRHRTALLAGFLSQKQQFGSLEALLIPTSPALRMWANGDQARLDPGQNAATDWACLNYLHPDTADPLGVYLEAAARENGIDRIWAKKDIPTGWCSWYHFFQNIREEDIAANLEKIVECGADLPLEMVQIDDGFEAQVGDWGEFSAGFPKGAAPLAAQIRSAGLTPGLWLAPFIVHPKSRAAREHPDWLLRRKLGRPVNAGFIWDTFTSALDLTVPEALAYAAEAVRRAVHDWGFPFLKLDFLYAAALPGRYADPTQTRAQVLRKGLEALRAAAGPEAALLGCGCPLGSALGLVEAMRIGSDVDIRWKPAYKGINLVFQDEPDMPSARNAIQNVLTRAPMHRRWWINDPDCLLVRPTTQLSEAEVQTLASVIALSGGAFLLSDHLPDVPAERLRIARTLLPVIGERPHVLDWFDTLTPTRLQVDLNGPGGGWHLLGLFNWEDNACDLELNLPDFYLDLDQPYFAASFWDGKIYSINHRVQDQNSSGKLRLKSVPAHGAVVLALRPKRSVPQYLGGNLHISQGCELKDWAWDGKNQLWLTIERPGHWQGNIFLHLPTSPVEVRSHKRGTVTGTTKISEEGIYQIETAFENSIQVHLTL